MELRQLTYFLAAAQTQNFRRASELCRVAQPALSRQIAALEAELGLELFQRIKQRVILTSAGREFAIYAREALERLQQGQHAMSGLIDGQGGTVQLGCIEPLATAFLPAFFQTFSQRYPLVRLSVRVSRTDDVMNMVEQREVDLGLIFHPTSQREVLVVKELFRQPLRVLVPSGHPLAACQEVALEQLLTEKLVLPRENSRLRRIVDQAITRTGATVQPAVEIDSIAGLVELVRQGCGVTLLPAALLGKSFQRDGLELVALADFAEHFAFALVYLRTGVIAPPARQFIHMLTEQVGAEEPDHAPGPSTR